MLQSEFWTGLWNGDRKICNNEACVNQLSWLSDGSVYNEHTPDHGLNVGRKKRDVYRCLSFKGKDTGIRNSNCHYNKKYVCEFKCQRTAAPVAAPAPVANIRISTTGMIENSDHRVA